VKQKISSGTKLGLNLRPNVRPSAKGKVKK